MEGPRHVKVSVLFIATQNYVSPSFQGIEYLESQAMSSEPGDYSQATPREVGCQGRAVAR